MPFLGYGDLYDQFHLDEPWNSSHNISLLNQMPEEFESPNFPSSTRTLFQAVGGPDTVFPLASSNIGYGSITDGTSDTILFVESNTNRAIEWTRPVDLYFDPADPMSGLGNASAEGFSVVATARETFTLPLTISPEVMANLITRNDGNVVDLLDLVGPKQSDSRLREVALAVHNYESSFQRLPNQAIYNSDETIPLLSWRVSILPYIGQENLYDQFHLD